MIDLVIINPAQHALALANKLDSLNLTYKMYRSPNTMFNYNVEVASLGDWEYDVQYKSGFAFSEFGWINHYDNQIELKNKKLEDTRKMLYQREQFKDEGGVLFNFVSYKGKHVLLDAFLFKNGGWLLFRDQSYPLFKNGIAGAFDFLDSMGVENGPSQVCMYSDRKMKLRLSPRIISTSDENRVSTKSFMDIWPLVLMHDDATSVFDEWAEKNGGTKNFIVPYSS
jgi:hypothetical protein